MPLERGAPEIGPERAHYLFAREPGHKRSGKISCRLHKSCSRLPPHLPDIHPSHHRFCLVRPAHGTAPASRVLREMFGALGNIRYFSKKI